MNGCVGLFTDLLETGGYSQDNFAKCYQPQSSSQTLIDIMESKDVLCALDLVTRFERNSNLVCLDTCYFAVLAEADFTNVLREYEIRHYMNKLKAIRGINIFKNWEFISLSNLYFNSFKITFQQEPVFKFGDQSFGVFIIQSGSFLVSLRAGPNSAPTLTHVHTHFHIHTHTHNPLILLAGGRMELALIII